MINAMSNILKKISLKKQPALDSIHARKDFIEVLNRERLRTLRNGVPFSLLIFGKRNQNVETRVFQELVKVLFQRVRATDETGWYSDIQIGVLLPDTRSEGARILADDILQRNIIFKDLKCEVQSYPDNTESPSEQRDGKVPPEEPQKHAQKDDDTNQIIIEPCDFDELLVPPLPAWKRSLDIVGAGLGLIASFPLFLIIAGLIKIVSRGPVLYKQVRMGCGKKPFVCLKFRTMKVESDTQVHQNYLSDLIKDENKTMVKLDETDQRIIPFGKILRKTGLDELPQLINILRGDMSLVGPRPCTSYEASEYRLWQNRRFDAKPGLTGLWQVSGKNKTTFVEMMRLDIGYSISKSLLKDLWILIKTFPAVCVQVCDRFPKKEEGVNEKSDKYRRSGLRILGSKSDTKF